MPADDAPLFTPAQKRIVSLALSFGAVAIIAVLVYLLLAALGRFISHFSDVIWPLAVAGILALILRPVVSLFERRLHIRRSMAVVLLYGIVLLAIAGLLFALVPALIGQILDFISYLPTLWQQTTQWSQQHFPEWLAVAKRYMLAHPSVKSFVDGLAQQGQDLLTELAPSLKKAGAGIFGVFGFLTSVAVIPVYLFFFLLTDRDPTAGLETHLTFLQRDYREDVVFLIKEFIAIVVTFFRGQLLIGLIMGVLLATGFSLAGLKFGLALGLVIGLLNIVPYLGTILGLSVALPLAYFQQDGGWGLLAGCLGIFLAVQATEAWFLTPRIMGRRTGLHPVVIIIAILFWGHAFGGILGMVLAVPLTAFVVTAWRLLRRKYFDASPV
ncbi:MAG TPA: AI-2E family transporter [Candidatus Didemnitutus sp.]|nr:AI-2E family transporter [Candidatus Didemnitutus sp.]